MNLSCLIHRWLAGRDSAGEDCGVTDSIRRHAESCQRCAAYTQRLRALDSRFRSVRGAGEDALPNGLHSKIMSTVREVQLEPARHAVAAETPAKNWRGMFFTYSGAAAAIVFACVALWHLANRESGNGQAEPALAASAGIPEIPATPAVEVAPEKPAPTAPAVKRSIAGLPEDPVSEPDFKDNFIPAATRRVAEFTGELPTFLAAKVSEPYESEIELLADDLNAATDFLSECLFVSAAPQRPGL